MALVQLRAVVLCVERVALSSFLCSALPKSKPAASNTKVQSEIGGGSVLHFHRCPAAQTRGFSAGDVYCIRPVPDVGRQKAEDRAAYDKEKAAARAALGENAFRAVWEEGQAMTLEQAVKYALEDAE